MFGPPQRFTIASTCSWLGHSVSGLRHDTSYPLQIRFRFDFVAVPLNLASYRNSPARSTKSTRSHFHALSACKLTVSGSVSLPSRGSFHLSLTVLFAIGHMVVFSLLGWSPFLPSGFLVSRRTPESASLTQYFVYGDFTLFVLPFQVIPLYIMILLPRSLPQTNYSSGLGFSDFARHYSRNHFCFLLLQVLRCFNSLGCLLTNYIFIRG